jgi:hypothetical protein
VRFYSDALKGKVVLMNFVVTGPAADLEKVRPVEGYVVALDGSRGSRSTIQRCNTSTTASLVTGFAR